MRDIIWTVIVVWIVWKIYDAFTTLSRPRTRASYNPYGNQQEQQQQSYQQQTYQQQAKREGEVRIENKGEPRTSHFKPEDGEYVDYEEIK